MLPRKPIIMELDFPDIGAIAQDCVNLASVEMRLLSGLDDALSLELDYHLITVAAMVRIQFEDVLHFASVFGMNLNQASPVDSHILISIRSLACKKAFLDTSRKPFLDVNALLFRVEACHA